VIAVVGRAERSTSPVPAPDPGRPGVEVARARAVAAYGLLSIAVLLFPVFVVLASEGVPLGGNGGDTDSVRVSGVVAAVACVSATVGVLVAVSSIRQAGLARSWLAAVLNGLVALMSGVMAVAVLLDR
jgi:uncharacterized membrane protein YecN with MAPEG domain